MSKVKGKKNAAYVFGMVCGILAIVNCFVAIGFSVCNNYVSIYLLAVSLFLLGLNRIGLHLSNFKENMIENIVMTGLVFILALLVGFTKYSIYFLTTSMFLYSLSVIVARILKVKEDHSTQSIIFNSLCITFVFLFSFLFFFPAIYEKHATSVSNSNFIVMCYTLVIIVSSSKNVLFPSRFLW